MKAAPELVRSRLPRVALKQVRDHDRLNHSLQECWERQRKSLVGKTVLPAAIVLTDDSLRQMWVEHLARWSYYFDPALLETIGQTLCNGKKLDAEAEEYLKQLKNTGDDLRNFFQLFAVAHDIPKPVQCLVKIVGQLRDQVRLQEFQRARKEARELLILLAKAGNIAWPELRVDPAAMAGFLSERIAGMQQLLGHENISGYDFHQIKKDFRLVFSVYYYLHLKPMGITADESAFCATKKIIKKLHLVLVEKKYKNNFKYRDGQLTLPEEFRRHLTQFLHVIRITTEALFGSV